MLIARSLSEQRGGWPQPTLLAFGACLCGPVPENVIATLFANAIAEKVSDVGLQDTTRILLPDHPRILPKLQEILNAHHNDYPLTTAALLVGAGQYAGALQTVNEAPPGHGLDEIVRRVTRLQARLLNPDTSPDEDAQAFQQWADSEFPVVRNLLSELENPWEKLIAFGQLDFVLFMAENLGSDREQEVSFLMDEIRAQIKDDPAAEMNMKALEIRFQELRRTIS